VGESLPSGYVTFLMTDIEGSSRFWDKEPETMRKAIPVHDDVISRVIEWHGGVLLKARGEGDSAVGVFKDPTDAVACSLELQRELARQYWPTSSPIRVRVALNSGTAELRANDYYGETIIRCARLRSIAHGGQILLSRTTSEAVRESLPEQAALEDLGYHWLQGLSRPERVAQLSDQQLPGKFPPLRSEERVFGIRSRRRQLLSVAVSAALILISVFLATRLPSIFEKPATQPRRAQWVWMRTGLIGNREGGSVVWSGKEMLVWGGTLSEFDSLARAIERDPETRAFYERNPQVKEQHLRSDLQRRQDLVKDHPYGAAYDPSANSWQPLPDGPLEVRRRHSSVWITPEMIVWGGVSASGSPLADGAAFDPSSGKWRPLPAAPLAGGADSVAVSNGQEMLVWVTSNDGATAGTDTAAYDPVANTWRPLARSPVSNRENPRGVWTGREMVIWPGSAAEGAAYNPQTNTWRSISTPNEIGSTPSDGITWTGSEVVFLDSQLGRGKSDGSGVAYRPANGAWRRVALAPNHGEPLAFSIWSGKDLLAWVQADGSASKVKGAAYNPKSNTWRSLGKHAFYDQPLPTDAGIWDERYEAVSTGDQALIWIGTFEDRYVY
jgi:class 3 adenylate cyclase